MRPLMLFTLLVGMLLPAAIARADDAQARIDAAVDKALAEWTVLITCTALDPKSQKLLAKAWKDMSDRVRTQLKDKGLSSGDAVAARMAALAPLINDTAPASELIAFCHAHPDWQRQLNTVQVARPDEEISAILGAGK
jgi:hypothetical protein